MSARVNGAPAGAAQPAIGNDEISRPLSLVEEFVRRYIAFPSAHEPVAVALWVTHAHLVERFETSPILAVTSAEKRSGKTRMLDCLELLVPRPFRCIIPSEAVVYTVLSQRPRRTMLLDEADAIFGARSAEKHEGLRAILNAGNRQGTPVLRVKLEGRRREVDEFDVYGPKAIAGIGNLPDTVTDRAIPIRLKRRAPSEPVARFRRRSAELEAVPIGEWLEAMREAAVTLVPDVPGPREGTDNVPIPDELNDRAADSWEPLIALADAAGGDWPERARLAAIALSGDEGSELSIGIRLLSDIFDAFSTPTPTSSMGPKSTGVKATVTGFLSTSRLLDLLHARDDAPWNEWYGKPLSARGLSRLLEAYGVHPQQRRVEDGDPSRGYFAQDFTDSWARYLPSRQPGTSGTSGTDAPDDGAQQLDLDSIEDRLQLSIEGKL